MEKLIEIKNRWNGETIFSYQCEENTIAITLKKAIKCDSNLRNSNLRGSNLRNSNLRGSDLRGSDLSGSDLSGSDLRDSNLRGSNLCGSNLSYSNLSYSNLRNSNLRNSNLSYSNLSGSDLNGSDLSGSNLSGSNLRNSNLRDSMDGNVCRMDFGDGWSICIRNDYTQIGCKKLSNQDWLKFTPKDVKGFAGDAEEWWEMHGKAIKAAIHCVIAAKGTTTTPSTKLANHYHHTEHNTHQTAAEIDAIESRIATGKATTADRRTFPSMEPLAYCFLLENIKKGGNQEETGGL